MVWGLEKLWPSGSPAQADSTPASNPTLSSASTSATSNPTASLVPATTEPSSFRPAASSQSTSTTLSPAILARIREQESAPSPSPVDNSWLSDRSRKQFTLFAAGAAFFLLSSRMTRRQLAKRSLKPPPTFKQNNLGSDISVNGPLEAVEALSIATINVLSFTMMTTGGLVWAFDIANVDDLRRKIRGGLGVDGTGRTEGMIEEEFEEWLATVLERKKEKADGTYQTSVMDDEKVKQHWRDERGRERRL